MKCPALTGLMVLCLIVAGQPVNGQAVAHDGDARPTTFEVGYSANLFFDVDPNDARAVTKVWIEYFVDQVGVDAASETFVFEDVADIVSRLNERRLDLAVLLPEEYLQVTERCELEPILVTTRDGRIDYEYGLLVRGDRGLTRLADLEGGSITIERGDKGSVPRAWLEHLLRQQGAPAAGAFLGQITQVGRAAKAILPVFFGRADACLVNLESFGLMTELNPQLDRELVVLAKSPGFCRTLICMRADMTERYGGLLRGSLLSLHTDTQGQQLLSLFHVDELVPFDAAHLRGVAELIGRDRSPAVLAGSQLSGYEKPDYNTGEMGQE